MPPLQEDTATWTQQQVLLGIGALCVSGGLLLVDSLPANAHDLMAHNPVTTIDTATVMIPSSAMTDTPTIDMASAATVVAPIDWSAIFQKASKKALGGGKAGASAAVVQVFSLMWLRTSMNYQYRYGGNLLSSLQTLWQEGGIPRLYQGLPFALVQGPLTRFGDTAANVGVLTLLESIPETQTLPLPIKTVLGSIAAGSWRIILMPIDASKTAMQVEGAEGLSNLWNLTVAEGPGPLYQGALASAAATAVGHFPWYTTYNYLNQLLPEIAKTEDLFLSLARSALIGFSASCVSDVCSNSLRVIKTTKQTARLSEKDKSGGDGDKNSPTREDISYAQVVKLIIETDGLKGLFGRGLQTRLLTNSVQGAVFSVLWKYFQQSNGSA
ncbi:unnamed protein product [Cylindrotheca closterium]|uniref:Uncharacterized protein n=1 Tax=Cylindrotheca closterium TaxID=2856 RepID=A0AAD2PUW6_9STRA|nr:unnamed protein product [Cylindrotheca closterium]